MTSEQCWAMNGNGSRCEEPAVPEGRFCRYHGRNGGPSPLWIWRPPESETPPVIPAPPLAPDNPAGVGGRGSDMALAGPRSAAPADPARDREPGPARRPRRPEPSGSPDPALPSDLPAELGLADTPPLPESEADTASRGWFLTLLQRLMTEVVAGDGPPLQKANAVARLGGLYLKAFRTMELEQERAELRRQVAHLEQRAASAEARTRELETPATARAEQFSEITSAAALRGEDPAPAAPLVCAGNGSNRRPFIRSGLSSPAPAPEPDDPDRAPNGDGGARQAPEALDPPPS